MISKTSKVHSLSPEMERLYEKLHFVSKLGCGMATGDWPLVNIYKATDGAIVEALIPGIESSELKLSLREHVLTIDKNIVPCTVRKKDRVFLRTIEFPFPIDIASSTIDTYNGLLRAKLIRRENQECLSKMNKGSEKETGDYVLETLTEDSSPKLIPVISYPVDSRQVKVSETMVVPKTDIVETQGSYLMNVELPGIPYHAVDITLDGRALTVEAGKPHVPLQNIHLVYSEFETFGYRRRLSLFRDVDATGITALLKNGTLKVRLPKKIPEK